MTPRKAFLIINPISGTGDKSGIRELVEQRLGAKGFEVTTGFTSAKGDATVMASEAPARNGLARHLGIDVDVASAVEILSEGVVTDCDFGTANGQPFFCTFGVGFDAAVSEKFAQSKKRGPLTYLSNTVKEYVNYQPDVYTIAANGEVLTERAFLVAVCNASQYGNNA